LFVRRGRV